MNTQEQKRMLVLNQILDGQVSTAEAAALLKLSKRQVQRILAAYRKEGVAVLVHGNRGRSPSHRIREDLLAHLLLLAQTTYAGANQQHLRDLLEERDGIVVSRATVRRIVQPGGPPQRKPPQHRRRRKRYAQEGMLVQIDASPRAWMQERGPRLHLLAAIDDATGKLLAAIFRDQEDRVGYFQLVEQLVTRYGRPLAFYHDLHEIFPKHRAVSEADTLEEQLAGAKSPLQRLILSGTLSAQKGQELTEVAQTLDPIRLLHQLDQLQQAVFRCAVSCSPVISPSLLPTLASFPWMIVPWESFLKRGASAIQQQDSRPCIESRRGENACLAGGAPTRTPLMESGSRSCPG